MIRSGHRADRRRPDEARPRTAPRAAISQGAFHCPRSFLEGRPALAER